MRIVLGRPLRPEPVESHSAKIKFTLTYDDDRWLRAWCIHNSLTRSAVLRALVRAFREQEEKDAA